MTLPDIRVPDDLPVLEALHSTPARRRLSTTPIPDDVLWAVLDAAVRGPSGGNAQTWAWIVVREQDTKDRIAAWYLEGWNAAYGSHRERFLAAAPGELPMSPQAFLGAEHLAQHLAEAPVWVIPVLLGAAGSTDPRLGSSIYGAVQQLFLAARAFGVGTNLTTLYRAHEDDVRALLGLPDDALTMCLIPMGYPEGGRWSQPRRKPVADVVHWEAYGSRRERA
ncbi:nitroreductase family protein [Pseudolysinimonas kribbensis]|uniref:Oxidoreductase n=1 Tax=Pseudolysinimonas kribbensis TaxID=433641 RepID=A0ABQ6K4L2_9MICO|nr:nitroreductase family protein [Pseudolysinimonas kribbensis]GMA95565.1 putative oxidoreductase [Pseudolysinimonas kribbensis]